MTTTESQEMHRSHRSELRILLTCFYIYLNCNTFLYMKQTFFHNSLLTSPFTYPYTYVHIRAIIGNCISVLYRSLLLYALWRQMPDLLLVSIIFLIVLLVIRLIFDIYGYYSGYIARSLYYPFESFKTKSMFEEITDLILTLACNCFGLIFSIYMLIDMMEHNTSTSNNRTSSISEEI